ncbi:MAG: glycine--tRNA ligase, partial [Tepidisphaeraceae bacterium]
RNMVITPPIGPDGHPIEMVGIDTAIIQNPKTWVASGHVAGFNDPMVDDRESKQRYRADHVMVLVPKDGQGTAFAFLPDDRDAAEKKVKRDARRNPADYDVVPLTKLSLDRYGNIVAPAAKLPGTLTEPRAFNLMFVTFVGALQSEESKAYLRPETAQGIFLNFKNVIDTTRVKLPFGVAQVGKSFRNEVTPRNFIFRSREFEQMEMEWFCHPDEAPQWYEFWKAERMKWWRSIGVSDSNLRLREHEKDELSHYSKMTVDIEYKYPFTAPDFGELEGIAHRGCFDLTQHQQHSGQRLDYFDQELQLRLKEQGVGDDEVKARSRYIPNVIEPASGLTRAVLVLLCEGYTADESRPSKEFMKFTPEMAPIKAGVFPLVNKEGMPEIAERLYLDLRTSFTCEYDAKQSIGKRYARMDEVGTPFCLTVDGETLADQTVTVRDRDTATQQRIGISQVRAFLAERLGG